jgi:transposase
MEGMVAALEIRKDRSPTVLRKLAKAEGNTRVARRILAIANALDGMSRAEAARSAGMDRQTLRDWVLRYNEHGIDGLADRWGDGRPPTFDAQEQAELMRIVLAGPDPETSGLSAYTLEDLAGICEQRFGKRMHPWSLGRLLKRLGLSRQKARPSHPQKDRPAALKRAPALLRKFSVRISTSASAAFKTRRIGQKGRTCHVW